MNNEKSNVIFQVIEGTTAHKVAPVRERWGDALPLVVSDKKGESYPVDALGPVIGGAVRDVSNQIEAPLPIVANTALAGAALACSGLAQVEMPQGEVKPISLYLLTIAASNDRKSCAERRLIQPFVRDVQKEVDAIWSSENGNSDDKFKLPPVTVNSPTIQAVIDGFQNTPVCALFSDEGGSFLNGYSMQNGATETATTLNSLFNGDVPRDTRIMRYTPALYNRSFNMHLMVQTGSTAAALVGGEMANSVGLLSRFLSAQPETLRGTRFSRERWHETEALARYIRTAREKLLQIFNGALERNYECDRRIIKFSPNAAGVWWEYRDECELMAAPGQDYDHVFSQILRSPEHAARLAGVLWEFDGNAGDEINAETACCGIAIARWYRDEAIRIAGSAAEDRNLVRAARLWEWIRALELENDTFKLAVVYQKSPSSCKCRNAREARFLLAILEAHNLVAKVPDTTTAWVRRPSC